VRATWKSKKSYANRSLLVFSGLHCTNEYTLHYTNESSNTACFAENWSTYAASEVAYKKVAFTLFNAAQMY